MAINKQLAVAAAAIALIGGGVAIWQLSPQGTVSGDDKKLGEVGKFAIYAIPAGKTGQKLQIRRDGDVVWTGPDGDYVRVELMSTNVDVAGGTSPDIVAYGWTGGASCCLNYVVYSVENGGALLGTIPRQGGDMRSFVSSKALGMPAATLPSFDLAAQGMYGGEAGSPLARVFIAYNGKRFGLDTARMKAATPEAPPAYMVADPTLVAAIAAEALEDDFLAPEAVSEVPAAYTEWLTARINAAAADELIDATNPETFITPALVLNEYVYKGQAAAGVAALEKVFAKRPGMASAIFTKYFSVLKESQWLGDIDALNGGAVQPLLTQYAKT